MKKKRNIVLGITLILLNTISCIKTSEPGSLVPATVDIDMSLPSLDLRVGGHSRLVHYLTFGSSENPALFILHGSLSDMRAYLPLQELSEHYYVVMWDQRGNGLSERVSKEELAIDMMVEEIVQMKEIFSPDNPISILGHSWSAIFVTRFLAEHPDDVRQAILMEPFGLKDEYMDSLNSMLNLTSSGYLNMFYSSAYLTPKDNETLDFRMLATLKSAVRDYFCDCNDLPEWPVWRVGGLALMVWEREIITKGRYDYDFTPGISDFHGQVLLVGSECSPIGYNFQDKYHQGLFQNLTLLEIHNSGHRMLTEQYNALINGIKDFLYEYNN
jgi:proline iminopeptidase